MNQVGIELTSYLVMGEMLVGWKIVRYILDEYFIYPIVLNFWDVGSHFVKQKLGVFLNLLTFLEFKLALEAINRLTTGSKPPLAAKWSAVYTHTIQSKKLGEF